MMWQISLQMPTNTDNHPNIALLSPIVGVFACISAYICLESKNLSQIEVKCSEM